MRRVLWAAVLALGLAGAGFLAGGWIGGRVLARLGDGLGGSAAVFLGGAVGAVAGLLTGVVVARILAPALLPRLVLLVGLFDAGGLVLLLAHVRARIAARRAPPVVLDTVTPPLPVPGTADTLLGLLALTGDSLTRYETREYEYEVPGVTVYRRNGQWFLLGLEGGGRVWRQRGDSTRFQPLEELVVNRLNWLTEAWDTRLRETPDPSAPARQVPVARDADGEVPAKVLEARRVGGGLWLRVEVQARSPCEDGTTTVIATGWIPAWHRNGQPTAWFYSRGC